MTSLSTHSMHKENKSSNVMYYTGHQQLQKDNTVQYVSLFS